MYPIVFYPMVYPIDCLSYVFSLDWYPIVFLYKGNGLAPRAKKFL